MPMRTLPFAALRVFEAVARLGSFSRAAEALGMTQSAVSQHVRAIEEWTGRRLILRGRHKSVPSEEGQRLATAFAQSVASIEEVLDDLRQSPAREGRITLACQAGFAVNWLFPRLYHFDHDHPTVPVSVLTQSSEGHATDAEVDVTILYAPHQPRGLRSVRLFGEQVFPVCSPDLQNGPNPICTTADLARHTCLVDFHGTISEPPDWNFWARQTGQVLPEPIRQRRFGQSNMTIQAAIRGEGVALGRGPLVMDALRSGSLVAPLPHRANSHYSYWFAVMPGGKASHSADLVLNWLQRTIKDLDASDGILVRPADTPP